MLTALLVFIIILSILVFIHELGHFYAAKKMGVRVEEFGLGIPPRIWGKKIGETLYSINALPFGGFVKLAGEDEESIIDPNDPANFSNKKPLQKLVIIVAGVFMNLLLALGIFYAFFALNNFTSSSIPLLYDYDFKFGEARKNNTVIFGFEKDSPAYKAGVNVGESILEIDGHKVFNVYDVRYRIKDKANKEVSLKLLDTKKIKPTTREVKVIPTSDVNGNGFLGVAISSSVSIYYGKNLVQKLTSAFAHSFNIISYSLSTFGKLISSSWEQKSVSPVSSGVAGPVGIFAIVGVILDYKGVNAALGILDFMAVLSLSLAFMNILPIPALDGGRALFATIELVFRKKVSPSLEASLHKWGLVALLGLTILVTAKDIFNLAF